MRRIDKYKVQAGSGVMGMHTLLLDKKGNLQSINGLGSSWNETAFVVKNLNLQQLANRFAIAEQGGAGLTVINQLDSVQQLTNNTSIKFVYSRPQVRGRTIFGAVVPWNRFWRTGANAATRMVIDKPVFFGDKQLAAGAYSVWTMPTQKGWTMMFNSQALIWGTEYDPLFDVLHVPMQTVTLPDLVEMMTIEVKPSADGGVINVLWENTKASAFFTTK